MSEKVNIREVILIGRDAESNFVADDASVSRQHAQIIDYGTYYTVVDLGSTNGTYVNGRRVASETTLHAGDQLKVGNVLVPWEQLVQPPQKSKKAKILLAILIPVIVMLLVGGALAAYFIWWHGNNELEKESKRRATELSQQMTENKKQTEEYNKEKSDLEQQRDALDAEKKKAIKDKEAAQKEIEKAQAEAKKAKADAEKAKKDAEKAKADAEKAKAEANKAQKENTHTQTKKKEDKKKEVDSNKAQESQELNVVYDKVKSLINKSSASNAWNTCYDLGMTDLPRSANAKNELLKEATKAFNNKNISRLEEIEKTIKKNTK